VKPATNVFLRAAAGARQQADHGTMHIGLIGGIERGSRHYEALAARNGHTVEIHSGHLSGRGGDTLAALVDRSDVVVVITDVNSHAGMWGARRLAKARGRPCVLVRRLGVARFNELLANLDGNVASKGGSPSLVSTGS
jgi:hypothetical protein